MGVKYRGKRKSKPRQYDRYKSAQNILGTSEIPDVPNALFQRRDFLFTPAEPIIPLFVTDGGAVIWQLFIDAPDGMRVTNSSCSSIFYFRKTDAGALAGTSALQTSFDGGTTWTTQNSVAWSLGGGSNTFVVVVNNFSMAQNINDIVIRLLVSSNPGTNGTPDFAGISISGSIDFG